MSNLWVVFVASVLGGTPQLSAPVANWHAPAFHIRIAPSLLEMRGHIATRKHAQRLLATTKSPVATEFYRHIILPENWRDLSIQLANIAPFLESGEIVMTRQHIRMAGFTTEDSRLHNEIEKLIERLPTNWVFNADDLQTLTPVAQAAGCDKLLRSLPSVVLLFERNSSDIRGGYLPHLNRVADSLRHCPELHLTATGHADGHGSARGSQAISLRRARAVIDYLQSKGVPAQHLRASGKGNTEPVASNATWEGRNQNRRVTLRIYSAAGSSAGP